MGFTPDRAEIDADWRRKRLFDIEQSRGTLAGTFAEYPPPMQRLLRFAGLDPEHALVRWGNFDRTVLLPATVFEPDDTGRSYRFRPNVRSIWVRNFPVKGPVKAYFQVPDAARSRRRRGRNRRPDRRWIDSDDQLVGPARPEPDLTATWRGIVLGDSYMQGLFVGGRADAGRMPEARPQKAAGSTGRNPEHGPPRILARAVLLHVCWNTPGGSHPSSSWSASSPTISASIEEVLAG